MLKNKKDLMNLYLLDYMMLNSRVCKNYEGIMQIQPAELDEEYRIDYLFDVTILHMKGCIDGLTEAIEKSIMDLFYSGEINKLPVGMKRIFYSYCKDYLGAGDEIDYCIDCQPGNNSMKNGNLYTLLEMC